jgi:hypothetical protein
VGEQTGKQFDKKPALIERWDGAAWTIVDSGTSNTVAALRAVTAIGPGQAYAVGTLYNLGHSFALVESNLGEGWGQVSASGQGILYGIASTGLSDVQAVGETTSGTPKTLAKRYPYWDTPLPTPAPGSISSLFGISADAIDDAWGVGTYVDSQQHPLVIHWNGNAWDLVPTPTPPGIDIQLRGVLALTPADVWAVGWKSRPGVRSPKAPVAIHWNGAGWTFPSAPAVGKSSSLFGVAGVSSTDLWAVGSSTDASMVQHTLIEHWDGANWIRTQSPDSGPSRLNGVTIEPGGTAWTVGTGSGNPLALRFEPCR